jgi:hypothetical protein
MFPFVGAKSQAANAKTSHKMMHSSQSVCGTLWRRPAWLVLVLGSGLLGFGQPVPAQEWAQPPAVHYRWSQEAAPGEIGSEQVRQGVVPPGYFQPVRVSGPEGLEVGVRSGDGNEATLKAPADFALLVGPAYRLRLTGIPDAVGVELYPSVELIDRLHPPEGVEGRHPIQVHLTREDLELALTGRLVTKVIYLEQQDLALPAPREEGTTPTYDTTPEQDALQAADVFGRPVAIVRIGQWVPLDPQWSDDPLGPPPPVIFPIGAAGQTTEVAADAPRPQSSPRRVAQSGTASTLARTREVQRAKLLFPSIKRQGAREPNERALHGRAAIGQEGKAAGRSVREEHTTGWRPVKRRKTASPVTWRSSERDSADHGGRQGGMGGGDSSVI